MFELATKMLFVKYFAFWNICIAGSYWVEF